MYTAGLEQYISLDHVYKLTTEEAAIVVQCRSTQRTKPAQRTIRGSHSFQRHLRRFEEVNIGLMKRGT